MQAQVGARVRQLRMALGLTQEALAERAGLNYAQVQRLEQGLVNPTLRTLHSIAEGLNVPLSALFREEPAENAQLEIFIGLVKGLQAHELEVMVDLCKAALRLVPERQS